MEDHPDTPRAISPGSMVRLPQDALTYLEISEWEFQKVEKGLISLLDRKKGHILRINFDDIEGPRGQPEDEWVSA